MVPKNPSAQMVIQAQSSITDLLIQMGELQKVLTKQQALIDSLLPTAEWGTEEGDEAEELEIPE